MSRASQVAFDQASLLGVLNSDSMRLRYNPGAVIFAQGDEASAVFYIEQGAVKNSCISQSGKERIIGVLKEREFFGTGCITGFTRRRMTAVAITDCVVLQIEKPLMIDIMYRDPRVAQMFITFLVDQTRYYEEALVGHLLHSSEERLARTLLRLSSFGGEGNDQAVLLPKISQKTLAEIVGTTRSRINFFMNKFREQGLVEYDGRILVHPARLKQMLGEQQKSCFMGTTPLRVSPSSTKPSIVGA